MKIGEILKKIKGVFKPPQKRYYLGKLAYGTPYFYPWNFNSTIFTIKKNKAKFSRCSSFKLFNYNISYGWPIYITWYGLGWKDKFDSPRYEWSPSFQIYFFKWQFCIFWEAPDGNSDKYYEQILWYLNYSNKNIEVAKNTWGWVDFKTKKSTWNDEYLEWKYKNIELY